VTSDPVRYLSLPYDFSDGVILPAKRRAGVPHGLTSIGASSSAIDRPFGEMPRAKSSGWKKKDPRGQRVLNGVSGVRVSGCAQAASKGFHSVSSENGI